MVMQHAVQWYGTAEKVILSEVLMKGWETYRHRSFLNRMQRVLIKYTIRKSIIRNRSLASGACTCWSTLGLPARSHGAPSRLGADCICSR